MSPTTQAKSAEELFVQWWLRNATVSNVELAHLSNLDRSWRRATQLAIVAQASQALQVEEHNESSVRLEKSERRRLLLLPSMARHLLEWRKRENPNPPSEDDHVYSSDTYDSFCAAWFHPDGIQEVRISLNDKVPAYEEEHDETLANSHHSYRANSASTPFAPSGAPTYAGSHDENGDDDRDEVRSRGSRKEQQRDSQRSRSPVLFHTPTTPLRTTASNEGGVATCTEWEGYHTAMQVLQPFGYAASFVRNVLASIDQNNASNTPGELVETPTDGGARRIPEVTFAVRGAVTARPESYCYCVDHDDAAATAEQRLVGIRRRVTPNGGTEDDDYSEIRWQEYQQSLRRKEQRRRELQRDVLPRILTRASSRVFLDGPEDLATSNGRRQLPRAVQFLNAAGSHAVCMMTPPFACGPIPEPVTILCVGIATEDGCFLSGLHSRFEFGHLYPNDEIAEATELSPVCIATEYAGNAVDAGIGEEGDASMDASGNTRSSNGKPHYLVQQVEDDEEDDVDVDGDSSCDGSENEIASSSYSKCTCIFQGVGEKLSALDEEKPRRVHRGRLGPGMWHCYVAVFDGDTSTIRIDGVEEPMQSDVNPIVDNRPSDRSRTRSEARLDGLTIGSDHCFGMSLCCGNGSGGEGEGAIAELAVFQGRLELEDLMVLERDLMARHGIPSVASIASANEELATGASNSKLTNGEMVWRENEWARRAHALFFLSDLNGKTKKTKKKPPPQIPLRFLSRHRSVAWKQLNPVTGEPLSIKRIGCKPGASSSDL
jgi:hypothetical protein